MENKNYYNDLVMSIFGIGFFVAFALGAILMLWIAFELFVGC